MKLVDISVNTPLHINAPTQSRLLEFKGRTTSTKVPHWESLVIIYDDLFYSCNDCISLSDIVLYCFSAVSYCVQGKHTVHSRARIIDTHEV